MANGVLASYQSATTKYSHAYVDPATNPNGLVRADFPMYTTPSATLTSGSLRMMNNDWCYSNCRCCYSRLYRTNRICCSWAHRVSYSS